MLMLLKSLWTNNYLLSSSIVNFPRKEALEPTELLETKTDLLILLISLIWIIQKSMSLKVATVIFILSSQNFVKEVMWQW